MGRHEGKKILYLGFILTAMDIQDTRTAFLRYLETEKRYSVHTRTAYGKDLEEAFAFFGEEFECTAPQMLKSTMVRTWVMSLSDAGRDPKTIHRKISSLRSYYKYLIRQGLMGANPLTDITVPKLRKKLPNFVEEDRMETLLDKVAFGDDFAGVRNKAMIELFYGTGMRLSELVGMHTYDIDTSRKTVKVLGKRNKERLIPVPIETMDTLMRYLQHRSEIPAKDQALFITEKGARVYPKLVYNVVHTHLAAVTTQQKKSPHVLRHSYATHLLNNGADINAIKELLGHANLSATQVYTHNTPEKLKKIHTKTHPRG